MYIEEVERFMPAVAMAIKRHVEYPSDAFTDIYNRAYEAVASALQERKSNLSNFNVCPVCGNNLKKG
jgi:hypothetical protein